MPQSPLAVSLASDSMECDAHDNTNRHHTSRAHWLLTDLDVQSSQQISSYDQSLFLQARRPPTGASPNVHDSPAHDFGVRKPTFTKCSGVTPSHLRRRSMSADLEHTDVCETSITYPASPGDQQVICGHQILINCFPLLKHNTGQLWQSASSTRAAIPVSNTHSVSPAFGHYIPCILQLLPICYAYIPATCTQLSCVSVC